LYSQKPCCWRRVGGRRFLPSEVDKGEVEDRNRDDDDYDDEEEE
jgi:hypothetical protein